MWCVIALKVLSVSIARRVCKINVNENQWQTNQSHQGQNMCRLKCQGASACPPVSPSSISPPRPPSPCALLTPPARSWRRSGLIAVVDGSEERRERGEMERQDERVQRHKWLGAACPFAQISDLGAFRCADRRGSCEAQKSWEEAKWTREEKKI